MIIRLFKIDNIEYLKFLKNIDNIAKIIPSYKSDQTSKNLLFLAWLQVNKNSFRLTYLKYKNLKNQSEITELASKEDNFTLFLTIIEKPKSLLLPDTLSSLSVEGWIAAIEKMETCYGAGVLAERASKAAFSSKLFHTSIGYENYDGECNSKMPGKIPTLSVKPSAILATPENQSEQSSNSFLKLPLPPKTNDEFPEYIKNLEKRLAEFQKNPTEYTETTNPETVIKILEATIEHQKTVLNLYNYLIKQNPSLKDCISLTAKSLYPNSEGSETPARFDLVIELDDKLIVAEIKSNPEHWGSAVSQVLRYAVIIRKNDLHVNNQHKQPTTILPIIVLSKAPEDENTQTAINESGFNIFIFNLPEDSELKELSLNRLLTLI